MTKVKIPLSMADGAKVRTIEELREHFDIISILSHYASGKLLIWLQDRHYIDEAKKIGGLDSSSADIEKQICNILGVICTEEEIENNKLADISDKNNRLKRLKKYTNDEEVLKMAECVAFTQEDLRELVARGEKTIYLCPEEGVKFEIPSVESITYIGVNYPSANIPEGFDRMQISFQNVDTGIEKMLQDAKEYAAKGDNKKAAILWESAAECGNSEAQYEIGKCYHRGYGVQEDVERAIEWYQKAAEQGNEKAKQELGEYFYGRDDIEQDNENFKWFMEGCKQAANQGDEKAQYKLACIYYTGEGVPQDYEKAFPWFIEAAEHGNEDVLYPIAECYYYGRGVQKDKVKAFDFFEKAAEHGDERAMYRIAESFYKGTDVPQNYKVAFDGFKLAAEKGNKEAYRRLAECYHYGYGVSQNIPEAIKNYKKVGDKDALQISEELVKVKKIYEDGVKYYNGEDNTPINQEKAFRLFKEAADQGLAIAQYRVGICYRCGYGVWVDVEKAKTWYRKAIKLGYKPAQNELDDIEGKNNST